MGQRRALKVRHPPGVQMDPAAGDLPLMASDIASRAGDDAHLLLQFAGQRLRLAFTRLHFAAGELPHPRLVGVGRTLRQQNLAILFNNGGDNINHF